MEHFLIGEEVFFGFYRTDGVNLTKEQSEILEKQIPDFFREGGDMQNLNEYLSIAKVALDEWGLDLLPQIFDYYLVDSGDFVICFDPEKCNPREIQYIASETLAVEL